MECSLSSNGFLNFKIIDITLLSDPELDQIMLGSISTQSSPSLAKLPANVIGSVTFSTFVDKWGTPRQGQLSPDALSIIEISDSSYLSLHSLSPNTSLIVIWIPHMNVSANPFQALIRPPKNPQKKVGVFSTRSPHRPSNICMSIVKIQKVTGTSIEVTGGDMTLGTPILNLIPYNPELHAISNSVSPTWVLEAKKVTVHITLGCLLMLTLTLSVGDLDDFLEIVKSSLKEDPRSTHSKNKNHKIHGIKIGHANQIYGITYFHGPNFILVLKITVSDGQGKLRTQDWLNQVHKKMPFLSEFS
jgi:tRNA (adenine37-N6)-methyltransferase